MTSYLRTRLHFLIGLAGGLVFVFGIFILASGFTLRGILGDEKPSFWEFRPQTCQYWAGIPTILTGGVLVLTVFLNKDQTWKYISICCVLVTMVLTQAVIMEESSHASNMHDYHHNVKSKRYKKADIWYYILLYATDIVSVLSSFVMLLLFADWILFVAPELSKRDEVLSAINGQAFRHFDESGQRLCPPQVQNQTLSVAGRPSPCNPDKCRARSSPPQAQEQVWLPLETR